MYTLTFGAEYLYGLISAGLLIGYVWKSSRLSRAEREIEFLRDRIARQGYYLEWRVAGASRDMKRINEMLEEIL